VMPVLVFLYVELAWKVTVVVVVEVKTPEWESGLVASRLVRATRFLV